jgi:hypothetical protein
MALIKKEVRKLFETKIIVSLRFYKWLAILVMLERKVVKSDFVWTLGI